jgi:hypothetical protein
MIVERASSVLDGGQRELETPGELDVGVAKNRLSQQLLLCPREPEPRRRLDECGSHGKTEVREHFLPRHAEEERTLAGRGQRFAAPLKKVGVVCHDWVRAALDPKRRHFIPQFNAGEPRSTEAIGMNREVN